MANQPQPAARGGQPSSSTTRVLLLVTLFGVGIFLGSIGLVVYLVTNEDPGKVQEGSFLRVKLAGPLFDAPIQGGLFLEPDAIPPTTTEIAGAIRKAAGDDRITGMYLTLDGVGGGWGSLQEVRSAMVDFREAGKPCVAYAETWSNGSYYLASACDQVMMAPAGISMVNGLAASTTYYAGTFEKLGVEAHFEHVGDFKSAVEPYERSEPSEAASEAMIFLLDGIYANMVDDIAAGRGRTSEEIRALIDSPPMSPHAAVERGLVDGLVFPDALLARAPSVADEGWLEGVDAPVTEAELEDIGEQYTTLREYLKGIRVAQKGFDKQIAVVHAEGTIMSGEAGGGLFGSSALTDRAFREWMTEAREDDDVVAVVVRVNSPGGSGLASDMMWNEVKRTQAAGKPVVVSMADYAASGGYYISAPADWVIAQPSTITGSIGVFGGKVSFGGLYEKLGMTSHTYKRGSEADLFSTNAGFSEEGREIYRRFLTDFYETFLERVSDGREMDRDAVHEVAQGRVWTGTQALERGLVDELGGLDEALAKASELATVEEYGVVRLPRQKDFFEALLEDMEDGEVDRVTVALPGIDTQALAELEALSRVLDDGVAAMLPGHLTVE